MLTLVLCINIGNVYSVDAEHSWMPVICNKMHFTNSPGIPLPHTIPDGHVFGDSITARAYCELATNKV